MDDLMDAMSFDWDRDEGGVDDVVDDELCDGVTDSHRIARRCD